MVKKFMIQVQKHKLSSFSSQLESFHSSASKLEKIREKIDSFLFSIHFFAIWEKKTFGYFVSCRGKYFCNFEKDGNKKEIKCLEYKISELLFTCVDCCNMKWIFSDNVEINNSKSCCTWSSLKITQVLIWEWTKAHLK